MTQRIASLLIGAGLVALSGAAAAHSSVGVGISFGVPAPVYYAPPPPPVVYYPRPVYYEPPPPPVYYAPAPVYYAPPPPYYYRRHHGHHRW
jgi:hypothetical protein